MTKEDIKTLKIIVCALVEANRFGDVEDQPEGSRWIQLSDTVATQMAKDLMGVVLRYDEGALPDPWPPDGDVIPISMGGVASAWCYDCKEKSMVLVMLDVVECSKCRGGVRE